jgi:hypothetical protein
VLTTREVFPQPVCDGKEQRQDERCAAAHDLHQAMQAAYKGMLRDGKLEIIGQGYLTFKNRF